MVATGTESSFAIAKPNMSHEPDLHGEVSPNRNHRGPAWVVLATTTDRSSWLEELELLLQAKPFEELKREQDDIHATYPSNNLNGYLREFDQALRQGQSGLHPEISSRVLIVFTMGLIKVLRETGWRDSYQTLEPWPTIQKLDPDQPLLQHDNTVERYWKARIQAKHDQVDVNMI